MPLLPAALAQRDTIAVSQCLTPKPNMANETRVVRVSILGVEYSIEGDADPDHTREVARYVDGKMREVMALLPTQPLQNVAILASMEIADELLRARRNHEETAASVDERIARMVDSLRDAGLR